jgi:DNA helicase-2/ATP-dependent DNA helicase PcrA
MNLSNLNKNQKIAVEKMGLPVLVFAGAGSGKTRVLTYKIAYLINEIGLPPENILAVTFTNKAAQEMKSRVFELVDEDISSINIGTFHSISARILRKEIHLLGYSNSFTIYDQQDSKSLVKKVMKNLDLDIKQIAPKSMQIRISNAKNSLQTVDYFKNFVDNFSDKKFYEIYKAYQEELKNCDSLDFDDLLLLPLKLFRDYPDILNKYQSKFQYVLVDEYQDTNKPQFEFIYSLSSNHKNIFVVGDDDQSIYGWRGADISNILNFKEAFGESHIEKLEQNYRSTNNILQAAWSVVSKNTNRSDKKLWTENGSGELINLFESFDDRHEAKQIYNMVLEFKNNLNEIAILYRTNSQSRIIEDRLRIGGIPYQIIGGVKFYDRKEIKDVIAYIRFLVNSNDSISFDRIINFPPRGIGNTSVSKINEYYDQHSESYIEVLNKINQINLGQKQKSSLEDFLKLIENYKSKLNKEKGSEIVKSLISDLRIENYYLKQQTDESIDRWNNIQEFINGIEEYESNNPSSTLVDYLEEVSLLTDIDKWNDSENKVTLMTVHSSKGLEFDNIIIAGLEDGLFPIIRAFEDNNIEEERRLFYVALTRAKKVVNITYAKSRRQFGGAPTITNKSRFIGEIPEDIMNFNMISSGNNYKIDKFNRSRNLKPFSNNEIQVNNIVEHKVFGKGKVLKIEGGGENSKLTIKFYNNVVKKLILKYANLTLIKGH